MGANARRNRLWNASGLPMPAALAGAEVRSNSWMPPADSRPKNGGGFLPCTATWPAPSGCKARPGTYRQPLPRAQIGYCTPLTAPG